MDCLKSAGKEPEVREALTMLVMVGARTDKHFLSRDVGIGSRSHCLSGVDCMSLVISSMVAGLKEVKLTGGESGSGECGDVVVSGISDCSLIILPEKKVANDCAVVG